MIGYYLHWPTGAFFEIPLSPLSTTILYFDILIVYIKPCFHYRCTCTMRQLMRIVKQPVNVTPAQRIFFVLGRSASQPHFVWQSGKQ
jgi:hypothetical protein